MSRFRIKKQSLIAVAGIVWLLAGLNVAILGVRAAIDMRDVAAIVLIAIAGGAVAAFCGFHSMFKQTRQKNSQRIYELEGECHNPFRSLIARLHHDGDHDVHGHWDAVASCSSRVFIAFFYTGLGLALSLAGASYIARGVRGRAWAFHGTD